MGAPMPDRDCRVSDEAQEAAKAAVEALIFALGAACAEYRKAIEDECKGSLIFDSPVALKASERCEGAKVAVDEIAATLRAVREALA